MTAVLTSEVDARYRHDWSRWPVPTMPDVPAWPGPWNRDISTAPVDEKRTAMLEAFDVPVEASAGRPPHDGSSYGVPITLFDAEGRTTPVWDLSKPIGSKPGPPGLFGIRFPVPVYPVTQVALPRQVRRAGDPNGAFDRHAFLLDPKNRVLIEMILVQRSALNRLQTMMQTEWTVGYAGGGPGMVRYDMSRPWDPASGGIVAARTPKLPTVVRWQEIQRGVIDHTIFAVFPNSAPGRVGWARGYDGSWDGYPVRTGDILRLRAEVVDRYEPGTPKRVLAEGLRTRGMFNGDRSTKGDPTLKAVKLELTQDRCWHEGDGTIPALGDLGLRLADFEVIEQPAA